MLIHDSDGEEWADGLRYKMSENVAEPISETSGLLGKVFMVQVAVCRILGHVQERENRVVINHFVLQSSLQVPGSGVLTKTRDFYRLEGHIALPKKCLLGIIYRILSLLIS